MTWLIRASHPTRGFPRSRRPSLRAECGAPDQIVEHLKKLEAAYPGLEGISVSLPVGVPEAVALEHLERFATEVRPAFKTTAAGAAVVD